MSRVLFTGPYVRRAVDNDLDTLFTQLPAILLDGPKGVGKTATAAQRCITVRHLDQPGQRRLIQADPSIIAEDPTPLLIDEWQREPTIWDTVRRLVDSDYSPGQFLLTGSAPGRSTHSGAGRIATIRMRPLCLGERLTTAPTVSFASFFENALPHITGSSAIALPDYVDEILAGGFPAMRSLAAQPLATQLDSYLQRIVDHDMPDAGFTARRPAAVFAWLRAYAAATATTASWETIRDSATGGLANKPARTTTASYTELLTALRILDPIEGWIPSSNHFSRVSAAPKHHLADPALAARLLQRSRRQLLTGDDGTFAVPNDGTLLGNLFESSVAQSVRTYAQTIGAKVFHFRTPGGNREVDFIVELDGRVLALEAKLGTAPDDHDVRHLVWLRQLLGDNLADAAVINTGADAYRRRDGIAVVPLSLLGP